MADHPIQEEMKRIETAFEVDGPGPNLPIDECIASMVHFDGDGEEFDEMLETEVNRAVRLIKRGYYRETLDFTPPNVALIGFLQGVTFATAVRNIGRGAGPKPSEEEIVDVVKAAIEWAIYDDDAKVNGLDERNLERFASLYRPGMEPAEY